MTGLKALAARAVFLGGMAGLLSGVYLSAQIRDGGIDPANLGKGEWIFIMSQATNALGGNVPSVNNEVSLMKYFKGQGIQYVIVKAATSNFLYNGTYSSPQFTTNLCTIART